MGTVGLPFLDGDRAYLGHFCNNGVAAHEIPTNKKTNSSGDRNNNNAKMEEEYVQYGIASAKKAYAVHRDVAEENHMVMLAAMDIKEGEEIFVVLLFSAGEYQMVSLRRETCYFTTQQCSHSWFQQIIL